MSSSNSRYAAIAFFALMIIQISVAVVYKLAQKGGKYHFSPASALTMAEFFKFCISVGMQLHQEWPSDLQHLSFFARFKSAVATIYDRTMDHFTKKRVGQSFMLGLSYAINNHFAFVLFMLADASSITLIKSGSSFISTILAVTLLAKTVTSSQWISVLLQVCGLVMAQYNPCKSAALLSPFAYMLLFIHVMISGFNGIWNEDVVKNTSSLASQNLLLYAAGFLFNLWAYIILPNSFYGAPADTGFFTGYTPSAIMVVVLNSTIGVVITAVYKYADVIIKTFALACSTGSLFIIEYLFFHSELSLNIFVGIIVVYLSSYMYLTTGPPKPAAAPAPADDKSKKDNRDEDVNFCTAIIPSFLIQRFFTPPPPAHLP